MTIRQQLLISMIPTLFSLIACSNRPSANVSFHDSETTSIIGGNSAKPSDEIAKSTVLIVRLSASATGMTLSICTGSLLSPKLVVTAAHCLLKGSNENEPLSESDVVLAYFGVSLKTADLKKLMSQGYTGKSQLRGAQALTTNEGWPGSSGTQIHLGVAQNDIAVFELNADAPTGYGSVKLLESSEGFKPGATIQLAGYGPSPLDQKNQIFSLRSFQSKILSFAQDEKQWRSSETNSVHITEGDSGGPVFVKIGKETFLAGVLTNGRTGLYNSFESIPLQLDWIKKASATLTSGN